MSPRTQRHTTLGALVIAAFDEAARLTDNPTEVSRLATVAVGRLLCRAHSIDAAARTVVPPTLAPC